MKLSLDLRATLTQTLTPQQIQYLKLLQLPIVQLEQQVMQEIEQNPMLEEIAETQSYGDEYESQSTDHFEQETVEPGFETGYDSDNYDESHYESPKSKIDDQGDPFEFYKLIWQEDSGYSSKTQAGAGYDGDNEPFQVKDHKSFLDELLQQFRLLDLSKEEYFLGEQIIGNIDDDGYLRRELIEIVGETNQYIDEYNFEIQVRTIDEDQSPHFARFENPARKYALSRESTSLLAQVYNKNPDLASKPSRQATQLLKKAVSKTNGFKPYSKVTIANGEKVLALIQSLDPPGIGSRSMQECLVSQLRSSATKTENQQLALKVLTVAYEAFTKKHYHLILKQFNVTDNELREALDLIRRLNPKPGGGESAMDNNTIIPDFNIEKEDDTDELLITVNDSRLPTLRLSKAYEKLKRESRYKVFNKETREWIRSKYEDAKFLIQAIRQRKSTMLKVMTAIAGMQKEFFYSGPAALKPMIYKGVAENTGLDISTICRIVNGKYAQTQYGTFELKYFFSESLPTDEGDEISTRVIKQIIKDIVDAEDKSKPLSDDKISKYLKDQRYNVARRTVAKYREQMRIPVARLRKEL